MKQWSMSGVMMVAFVAACLGEEPDPAGYKGEVANLSGTNSTTITSESLEYDYERAIAVFKKDVVVVDQQVRMTSDRLTVIFDSKTREVRSVTAQGNVTMTQTDSVGTCQTAIYQRGTGEIIMVGKAKLVRPRDSFAGDRITFIVTPEGVSSVKAFGNVKLHTMDGKAVGGFGFGTPDKKRSKSPKRAGE